MHWRCFKPTRDDWYPSYQMKGYFRGEKDIQMVEVSCVSLEPFTKEGDKRVARVCVWGGDDCGRERDFEDREEAIAVYHLLMGVEFIRRAALEKMGFVRA